MYCSRGQRENRIVDKIIGVGKHQTIKLHAGRS
jgi:hypothetical protein